MSNYDGPTIFTLVETKKEELENLVDPGIFVLNPRAAELMAEIETLQNNCPHDFTDGVCKYCGKEEN